MTLRVLLAATGAAWLLLALAGSDGLFSIDELIYLWAAHAFADDFSLTVENGYGLLGSEMLRVWFLVPGPNGLAPQYPSGYPILAAPFLSLAGPKGMMMLNVAAALASVALCHRLALRLHGDRRLADAAALILALASFVGEYAVAVWPHAPALLAVLAATHFVAGAVSEEGAAARRQAFAAGLVVGFGLLARVDVVLVVPPLAIWAIAVAPRPLALVLPAALGALPGLAAATALNVAKFGIAFPVSYGAGRGGGVDPAAYAGLGAVMAVAVAACFLLRTDLARRNARGIAVAGSGMAVLALLLLPVAREAAGDLVRGAHVLLIDLRQIDDTRAGVLRAADGSVTIWNLTKKALGQSLPWLGILVFLAMPGRSRAGGGRQAHALCGLVALLWVLPFLLREWHGGYGGNMRYFLPVVPHLAILAAAAWRDGENAMEGPPFRRWLATAAAATALLLVAGASLADPLRFLVFLQQGLPPIVLAALVLAVLTAGLRGRVGRAALQVGRGLFALALCLGVLLGGIDLAMSQLRRGAMADLRDHLQTAPSQSVIIASTAEAFTFQIRRENGFLAMPAPVTGLIDHGLVREALDYDLHVLVQGDDLVERVLAADPALEARHLIAGEDTYGLWQVRRPAASE